MQKQSVRGQSPTGLDSPNGECSAVEAERRVLEYGLACAQRAREQVMDARQRISESLALVSEGVQA